MIIIREGVAFKVGDRVKMKPPSNELVGRVVEYRGPFGGNGAEVYRVKLRGGRHPSYIELRADQLELAPKPATP